MIKSNVVNSYAFSYLQDNPFGEKDHLKKNFSLKRNPYLVCQITTTNPACQSVNLFAYYSVFKEPTRTNLS